MRAFVWGAAALTVVACTDPGSAPIVPQPINVAPFVESADGAMPLVLVAPHGGDLSPPELPTRFCDGCITTNDANTAELAREISDAFHRRIARRPYVVINRLHRRKFDANRDLAEATGGYEPLNAMWALFHERVDSAKARARAAGGRVLLLDLHGHAHAIPRLELGYLLSASELRLGDAALAPLVRSSSSIARLDSVALAGDSGTVLLRGPRSLGARLAAQGYASVPSPDAPAPLVGEEYFSGGFNTERHGSRTGGAVDAIQIEAHNAGVRDTPAARTAFAEALVTALLAYLQDHYGWTPP